MKNNLIHGVHIFESDLANELDSIVEDAYHYGATEAEIRSLIDTFRKEAVRTALEKEIFLTLRLAILWQYGWLRPEEVAPLQQLVQKGLILECVGFTKIPLLSLISPVRVSSRQMPISIISLTSPLGGIPSQQVASKSIIMILFVIVLIF